MFENLDEKKDGASSSVKQSPISPVAYPPQGKVEDIFDGVKDTPAPGQNFKSDNGDKNDDSSKKKSGNLVGVLISVVVVLILAVVGVVLVKQKDLILSKFGGSEKVETPAISNESLANPAIIDADNKKVNAPIVNEYDKPSGMPEDNGPAVKNNPINNVGNTSTTTAVITETEYIVSTSTKVVEDMDSDGLPTDEENSAGTDPKKADTDSDGLLDGEEVNTYKTNPLKADTDNDELSDYDEVKVYLTNPNNEDTDADTYLDGKEVKGGYNPKGPGMIIVK